MDHNGFLVGAKLHCYSCCTQYWALCHISHLHVEFVWAAAVPERQLQVNEINDCFSYCTT